MSDDLDFSGKPAATPKPAAAPAEKTPAPVYIPAIARAFFESGGKEETAARWWSASAPAAYSARWR